MKQIHSLRMKTKRLIGVVGALLLYFLLIIIDAQRTFSAGINSASPFLWTLFGSSVLIALFFLAIGSLVWLYARNRYIASLLFCFSFTMMVTFVVETGAKANDLFLTILGDVASQFALFLLSILLLSFPRNYLARRSSRKMAAIDTNSTEGEHSKQSSPQLLLYGYVGFLVFLSLYSAITSVLFGLSSTSTWQLPDWLNSLSYFCDVIVLIGILLTLIISYRQSASRYERQQLRILVIGIIMALAPVLLLTILPLALNWPARYVIDARFTTLSLVLLPLAFGYAILRYQILVFDIYIRRAIAALTSVVSLAILAYLVVTLSNIFLAGGITRGIVIAIAMALLAPLVWYLIHLMIDRLFFSEHVHYSRLVERFDRLGSQPIDLNEAAQLIMQAVISAFETPQACLFVLDDETGYYHLYPSLSREENKLSEGNRSRLELVQNLVRVLNSPASRQGDVAVEHDWIAANAPAVTSITHASRPLLLSEATSAAEQTHLRLARYLRSTMPLGGEPLLVPVRFQGKVIGILALGQRGDQQQFGGPDFEAIEFILTRFAPVLETARLYVQANRHVALLNTLYGATSMLKEAFPSVEDAASVYAEIAARATQAGVRIWLYDEQGQVLRRTISTGFNPYAGVPDTLQADHEDDWLSLFSEGSDSFSSRPTTIRIPPCVTGVIPVPRYPFAWLPLKRGQQRLGVLILNYARPHVFSQQEKRVLEMFADQCAAAFESTRINLELRAAYERQKELDKLKDQFIMTASHELRTPLTAVMGYLELLEEYAAVLPPERLSDFIAKAHRGCDELTLMVSNIMDASRVQLDVEQLRLTTVPLAVSVQHILEILEGLTRREQRTMHVAIPEDLSVEADDLRLRQVLLNLVNNALKYSPAGTPVEISAHVDEAENLVTISISDHGLGVPVGEQHLLFERFTRLERDMNSPVRGAGLGLYICKQLVEAMGGHIRVESSGIVGEGSTFSFTLRRGKSQKPADNNSPAASLLR